MNFFNYLNAFKLKLFFFLLISLPSDVQQTLTALFWERHEPSKLQTWQPNILELTFQIMSQKTLET